MSAKHTPGPWARNFSHGHYGTLVIPEVERNGNPDGYIAAVNYAGDCTYGNAALIAAAPSLLAALEWAVGHIAEPVDPDSSYGIEYANALAAIEKAHGAK